jgi:hypothetical protein
MPRLSLYRPEKGNDYKFMDRRISEMFTVGGVDIHLHKYIGPIDQTFASNTEPGTSSTLSTGVTGIQDLLFLENRDRKYDTSVYTMRTVYRINDNDFDLTQFGLFLTGDTMFAVFHLNDMIETIGRKIMIGDVMELPNLKDFNPLDQNIPVALKRYYVVNDATRAAEGFAPTWYPHLWRVKLQPLVDSQEYKDIINNITAGDNTTSSIADVLSTYNKYIGINDAIVTRAETDVPASGYDTSTLYTVPINADGTLGVPTGLDASSNANVSSNSYSSSSTVTPGAKVEGYLTSDGLPPNGTSVAAGISFPHSPVVGDYYLRLDYVPNRLFRYDGKRWTKIEDAVRTNLTPGVQNITQRSGFVNDTNKFYSNSIVWDGIRVSSPYIPSANSATLSFTLGNIATGNISTIVTKTMYSSTYGVKTKVNSLIIPNTMGNTLGNVSFTISSPLAVGSVLEYTVYRHVVNERQSLSQALRPTADNL